MRRRLSVVFLALSAGLLWLIFWPALLLAYLRFMEWFWLR